MSSVFTRKLRIFLASALAVGLSLTGLSISAAPFEPEPFLAESPDPNAQAKPEPLIIAPHRDKEFEVFRAWGREQGRTQWGKGMQLDTTPPPEKPQFEDYGRFKNYTARYANQDTDAFLKGRYNRSRARLPENIETWRRFPDIANPGADLANFPNSAFTLPEGRAYLEFSPFAYYGLAEGSPEQYNMEFLIRYGLTDNIELRLFANGPAWTGNPYSSWSFSPIAFDTKIQFWTEKPDIFVPAMGLEAYLQTQWLGSSATNGGTQPGFSFNFDQSLPWDIDLEYNIGTVRTQNYLHENEWEFSFEWALQRDFFHEDLAFFAHGFINAENLPRLPKGAVTPNSPLEALSSLRQSAIGGGLVWTVNSRLAVYGQASAGLNQYTPALITFSGFAVAF
ncbi:MAG: transporter [Methylococcus sp.]